MSWVGRASWHLCGRAEGMAIPSALVYFRLKVEEGRAGTVIPDVEDPEPGGQATRLELMSPLHEESLWVGEMAQPLGACTSLRSSLVPAPVSRNSTVREGSSRGPRVLLWPLLRCTCPPQTYPCTHTDTHTGTQTHTAHTHTQMGAHTHAQTHAETYTHTDTHR